MLETGPVRAAGARSAFAGSPSSRPSEPQLTWRPRLSDVKAVYGTRDVTEYVFNRLLSVDVEKDSAPSIKPKERLRLSLEHFETVGDRDLVIVGTPIGLYALEAA